MGCFVKTKHNTIGGVKNLYSISIRLKELRAAAKLTQEEFAEIAGIGYKFYQQIESGRKKLIRLDTIQRLAEAYDLEIWEFFHPDIPEMPQKIKERFLKK